MVCSQKIPLTIKRFLKVLILDISVRFSERELGCLQDLADYLAALAATSTNFEMTTKDQRKTVRAEIPIDLKNVTLLVNNFEKAILGRRNGKRLVDDEDGWESDLTEMEFVDSDEELEGFLPDDVEMSEEEEASSSDDAGFEDEGSDREAERRKKAKEKAVKIRTERVKKVKKVRVSKKKKIKVKKEKMRKKIKTALEPRFHISLSSTSVSSSTLLPPSLKLPVKIEAIKKIKKPTSVFDRLKQKLKMRKK